VKELEEALRRINEWSTIGKHASHILSDVQVFALEALTPTEQKEKS